MHAVMKLNELIRSRSHIPWRWRGAHAPERTKTGASMRDRRELRNTLCASSEAHLRTIALIPVRWQLI
jgi:hypothetical protein